LIGVMFLDFNIAENKIKDIISNNQFSDVLQDVVDYLTNILMFIIGLVSMLSKEII